MRFFAELVLLFISLTFVQNQPVVPQINDLNAILSSSQFQQFLSVDRLQQLQKEIFATTATCFRNHWDAADIAQALEQLITQYVPQVNQMHIDWIAVGQSALDDVTIPLSNILSDTLGGLIHKRDLNANELQLLSQLPLDKLAQIAEVAAIPDRATARVRLQQLLGQFFSANKGRAGFDDLADEIINNVNNMLPNFNQLNMPYPG